MIDNNLVQFCCLSIGIGYHCKHGLFSLFNLNNLTKESESNNYLAETILYCQFSFEPGEAKENSITLNQTIQDANNHLANNDTTEVSVFEKVADMTEDVSVMNDTIGDCSVLRPGLYDHQFVDGDVTGMIT